MSIKIREDPPWPTHELNTAMKRKQRVYKRLVRRGRKQEDCTFQFSAALAVTGAWRGTSRQRLYEELGLETFYHRGWYRILCHFFSLNRSKLPEYIFIEILQERQLPYNLKNPSAYEQPRAKTVRYSSTYLHNTLFEWNLLEKEIQHCTSIARLKKEMLLITRLVKNSTFQVFDITDIKFLTRLHLHFSDLNEHRFRHAFDTFFLKGSF